MLVGENFSESFSLSKYHSLALPTHCCRTPTPADFFNPAGATKSGSSMGIEAANCLPCRRCDLMIHPGLHRYSVDCLRHRTVRNHTGSRKRIVPSGQITGRRGLEQFDRFSLIIFPWMVHRVNPFAARKAHARHRGKAERVALPEPSPPDF